MTRAWFRRRVASEPRRGVLLLATLEGLGGYALSSVDRSEFFRTGPSVGVWLLFAAVTPALGVLAMLAHGRVLWWAGKLLRGRARPHEIHAAFAWSNLPVVIVTAPLIAGIPIRAAVTLMAPPPAAIQLCADLLQAISGPLAVLAGIAAILGVVLYVRFLAEVQGFGAWRAIANHVLAVVVGLALLAAGIALGMWATPGSVGAVHILIGLAVAGLLGAAVEGAILGASRRPGAGSGSARADPEA